MKPGPFPGVMMKKKRGTGVETVVRWWEGIHPSASYALLKGRPWMGRTGATEAIWTPSKLLIAVLVVTLRIRCVQAFHTDTMHVQYVLVETYQSPIINWHGQYYQLIYAHVVIYITVIRSNKKLHYGNPNRDHVIRCFLNSQPSIKYQPKHLAIVVVRIKSISRSIDN